MLEKEKENPNYKPLSPQTLKPPSKDKKKLQDAEEKKRAERQKRRGDDKKKGKQPAVPETMKDKSLLD